MNNYNEIFDNTLFRGREATLTFYSNETHYYPNDPEFNYANHVEIKNSTIKVSLIAITGKEYSYHKATNFYYSNGTLEGIFDPVIFPSNVKGGTGIIGIGCSDFITVFVDYEN